MHDLELIRKNPEFFNQSMSLRKVDVDINRILDLDIKRRELITTQQKLQQRKNDFARIIADLKFKKLQCDAEVNESKIVSCEIEDINSKLLNYETDLNDILSRLPNIPDELVPKGNDEADNIEVRKVGVPKYFEFEPKSHYDLGENLNMMDFKKSAEISGSRFVILKSHLARLERALANFMLDIHVNEYGYQEISHPALVNNEAMYGVGQLPKFSEDSFLTTDGMRLVPTSEVYLTNLVANSVLNPNDMPIRFTAHSQCFRSEAGSAGKDTRGMIRQHQFSKVELVSIVLPDQSSNELERMTSVAEEVLKRLGLPYRVMLLCSGDMGFSAKMTYDIEVWLPAQNKYREISSCSNCGDFQARRMKSRYKIDKSTNFVHTLNGSALAIGRTIVAIIENYQNSDGSISIPEALHKYMDGINIISS